MHSDHTEFLSHSAPIPACRETGFDEMVKKPKDEAFIQSEQMLWLYAGQNEAKLCFCWGSLKAPVLGILTNFKFNLNLIWKEINLNMCR